VREWHFLGSGVLAKQLRSQRKGMGVERQRERGMRWARLGEQGQCRECTLIQVTAPNVRKNAAHKESSGENLMSIQQSLIAGPNCQAGRGKDGAAENLGQEWLL
jgi:hypothetical protein